MEYSKTMENDNFTVTWLCSSLKEDKSGFVSKRLMYEQYVSECKQRDILPLQTPQLTKLVKLFFPVATLNRKRFRGMREIVWKGLSFYPSPSSLQQENLNISNIHNFLCDNAILLSSNETSATATIFLPTNVVVDGSVLMKEIILNFNTKTWQLKVREQNIILSDYGVSDDFDLTEVNFKAILRLVNTIDICTGIDADSVQTATTVISESVNVSDLGIVRNKVRCTTCLQVLSWTHVEASCYRCRANVKYWFSRTQTRMDDVSGRPVSHGVVYFHLSNKTLIAGSCSSPVGD